MQNMGTVIVLDGKICSGKSTYSRRLREERKCVYLCMDEAMLRVFGDKPDMRSIGEAYNKLVDYILELAAQIAEGGVDAVLEHGYFTKQDRDLCKDFYKQRGVPYEWHYLDVSDETWRKAIAQRNSAHEQGDGGTTFAISEQFLAMFNKNFVVPEKDEVDVWVDNNW